MNKKIFIWFCGTDTTAKAMRCQLADCLTGADATLFIDGLGTSVNKEKAESMSPAGYWESFVNYVGRIFKRDGGNLKDTIRGYQEKHQLAQEYDVLLFLDKWLRDEQTTSMELVIGGHSRGAAAGMLGFLSALCSQALLDKNIAQSPFFKKVRKMTLIPVDPVAGPYGNDLLQTPESEVTVKYLLDTIRGASGEPALFDIISFNARFDVRQEFTLDDYWNDFFKGVRHDPSFFDQGWVRCFTAGFRHSAMVTPDEEITALYTRLGGSDQQGTPTALLQAIVAGCLQGGEPENAVAELATRVAHIERSAMQQLMNGTEATDLEDRTNLASYGLVSGIVMKGTPLKQLLQSAPKGTLLEYGGRTVLTQDEWRLIS